MTAIARSLDDLDRLAFRLSRTIRTQYPQLLAQGFTLSDLEERLLPYRDVRREMANGGADAFETALLQLIAGDRGYLVSDPALQDACRQALSFPSPTLAMVRAWATSTLRLTQASTGSTSGSTTGSANRVSTGASTTVSAGASAGVSAGPDAGRSGHAARVSASQPTTGSRSAEHDLFPAPSPYPTPAASGPSVQTSGAAPAAAHSCCRFCDNKLPQGRKITFCPYCGMDLTKRQCAACSTELEVDWRYCVTCGRQE